MFLSFIIAINILIWHWSQNVTIQMTFARNWRNMCKWRTKWPPCLLFGQLLIPHRTQNRIFCVESSSSEETPNTPLVFLRDPLRSPDEPTHHRIAHRTVLFVNWSLPNVVYYPGPNIRPAGLVEVKQRSTCSRDGHVCHFIGEHK